MYKIFYKIPQISFAIPITRIDFLKISEKEEVVKSLIFSRRTHKRRERRRGTSCGERPSFRSLVLHAAGSLSHRASV